MTIDQFGGVWLTSFWAFAIGPLIVAAGILILFHREIRSILNEFRIAIASGLYMWRRLRAIRKFETESSFVTRLRDENGLSHRVPSRY